MEEVSMSSRLIVGRGTGVCVGETDAEVPSKAWSRKRVPWVANYPSDQSHMLLQISKYQDEQVSNQGSAWPVGLLVVAPMSDYAEDLC